MILACMKSHLYQFKGKVRLQKNGGPTGLDLTGELADLFMLWWDQEFLDILEKLSIETDVYARFKENIDLVGCHMLSWVVRLAGDWTILVFRPG